MIKNGSGYTLVDLFSGAGGFIVGFTKANFNVLFSTDFDKDCANVHRKNMPDVPFLESDIYDISEETLSQYIKEDVDVLVGGPPCQGFSTIGARVSSNEERRHRKDPRNNLFRQYVRVLNYIKPKFFLMENVKGILTLDKGEAFKEIERVFKTTGYEFNVAILNAADYGIPQIRERVFIYGNRVDIKMEAPKAEYGPELKPYKVVLDAIGDLADPNVKALNHVPLKHGEKNIRRYALIPEGGRMPEDKLPPDLYRKNFGSTFKRLDRHKPSLTMVPGHNAFPIHPWLNRSLTVREAARIQTFPDDFEFMGPRQKQCMQVGNAVPPVLAYAWAQQLNHYLDLYYAKKK